MTELKPCPFCGGKARFNEFEASGKYMCAVVCDTKGCRVNVCNTLHVWNTKEEAIEAWNRRTEQKVERNLDVNGFSDYAEFE